CSGRELAESSCLQRITSLRIPDSEVTDRNGSCWNSRCHQNGIYRFHPDKAGLAAGSPIPNACGNKAWKYSRTECGLGALPEAHAGPPGWVLFARLPKSSSSDRRPPRAAALGFDQLALAMKSSFSRDSWFASGTKRSPPLTLCFDCGRMTAKREVIPG